MVFLLEDKAGLIALPSKVLFFNQKKVLIFFLFLLKNICCGYSLETPRRGCGHSIEVPHPGASNEYHNLCFHGEIKKYYVNSSLIWS